MTRLHLRKIWAAVIDDEKDGVANKGRQVRKSFID